MENLTNHDEENRPWGSFERLTLNEPSTVKIITVKPNEAFSLQTHRSRSEFWRILKGSGKITIGDETLEGHQGESFFIKAETRHRAEAGPEGLQFLEISFGDFNEEDIERLEDRYGRI